MLKVNLIHRRAGYADTDDLAPTTNAEFLEAIRIEKAMELFGEMNQPWFDMIRYHIEGDLDIATIKSTVTSSDKFILPFPTGALSGNGGLVQNPGYSQ